MKLFNQFVNERLKLTKDAKVKDEPPKDWSIENARPGDIVQLKGMELYFAYKKIRTGIWEKSIEYYWCISLDKGKQFWPGPNIGVGSVKNKSLYFLI